MGTIIAIKGEARTGKTTAIRAIYERLDAIVKEVLENNADEKGYKEFTYILEKNNDFEAIGEYNSKKIGIGSYGDTKDRQLEIIQDFADEEKCDIIICASRSKGETVLNVKNVSKEFTHDVIFTSHYQLFKRDNIFNNDYENKIASLNKIFALNIINLIDNNPLTSSL
jgi:signal recognition particle receptor subunit beta